MGKRILQLVMLLMAGALEATAADDVSAATRRSVAEVLGSMPKSQTSSDGFVTVVAADVPGDKVGFCSPLVQFASDIAHALGKTLALPTPPRRRDAALVIYAQDGRTNDTRVVSRVSRRRSGPFTRIWLPSPGFSDIGLLRMEIAKAYFRTVVEACRELPAPPGASAPAELPDWLVDGALRQTDIEQVREDLREVLTGWSDGFFPFFPALCARKDVPPVLSGYIVGWMKEKSLFTDVMKELAAGRVPDGTWIAVRLTGEKDVVLQDRASDYRLLRMLRKVISPGKTSRTDLRIFASRLLLYPPFYDKMFGGSRNGCTFREAVVLSSVEPDVRRVAARKAKEVPLYAIGRGAELQQASLAYMDFLLALSRGEDTVRLTELLDAAELKFGLAEEAVRKREEEGT